MGIDFKTIPMALVINIANIIILFIILRLLVYKPVKKFMDKRSDRIAAELQDAKTKHDQAELEQKNMALTLSKMEQTSSSSIRDKQAQAVHEAEAIVLNARKEAAEIVHQAREQAANEHREALVNLKDEVAKLSVDIAEKILARDLQQKDNAALVDEFFREVS